MALIASDCAPSRREAAHIGTFRKKRRPWKIGSPVSYATDRCAQRPSRWPYHRAFPLTFRCVPRRLFQEHSLPSTTSGA